MNTEPVIETNPEVQPQPEPAPAKKPCRALEVGHRSCDCPDCSYNAPKK